VLTRISQKFIIFRGGGTNMVVYPAQPLMLFVFIFLFGRTICIRPNSLKPLFGTHLIIIIIINIFVKCH